MSSNSLSLEERLNAHPQLKVGIDALLAIVEDANEEGKKADEAERRVIEELRRLGNEAMHSWAAQQEAEQGAAVCAQGEARAQGKKTLLVHDVWDHNRSRTPLLAGERLAAAGLPLGGCAVSELFATAAAADGRFWCRGGGWASAGQAQRTLWDRGTSQCGADHY